MSEQLAELGIRIFYLHVVPDGVGKNVDLVSQTGELDICDISVKPSKHSVVEAVRKLCPT
jgi:hypothetical protein